MSDKFKPGMLFNVKLTTETLLLLKCDLEGNPYCKILSSASGKVELVSRYYLLENCRRIA